MPSIRIPMTPVIALLGLFVIVLMVVFPASGMQAALQGVSIWWDILFPALFPFFVISELLLGLGLVHFFGTLFDPLMRPLFRVPGIGGFVMAMGFASGYPVGAKLTSQLWDQGLVNREEGERLVAFTTSSDPIFLVGAVSVGFFHNAGLAVVLAIAHYGTCLLVGILMRFHGKAELPPPVAPTAFKSARRRSIVFSAIEAMHRARIADGRPIGMLLQQAIVSSLKLMMIVGGLVVFFSVVLELLSMAHIMSFLYAGIHETLRLCGIPVQLTQSIVNGFFEVTLGAKSAGSAGGHLALVHKAAIAAFILSWGGISVHAQVMSILNHTGFRYRPFVTARLIHGILSVVAVYLIWKPLQPFSGKLAAIMPAYQTTAGSVARLQWSLTAWMIVLATVTTLMLVFVLIRRLISTRPKT